MELYLIRHTSVEIEKGVCYGQADIPLKSSFEIERDQVKKKIDQIDHSVVFASPLSRTRELAEFLFPGKVNYDKRLMELNFGLWELQKWDEIKDEHKNIFLNDFVNNTPPEGESFLNMFNRVKEFFNEILIQDISRVFLIAHGGTVRCIIADILGIPLSNIFYLHIDYGGITHISVNQGIKKIKYINT